MRPVTVQLTGASVRRGSDESVAAAREAFARQHLIELPEFLSPALLAHIRRLVSGAEYQPRIHDALTPPAIDYAIEDTGVRGALTFMFNDPTLFAVVEEITGISGIRLFSPVVVKMLPGHGVDTWHDDLIEHRLAALSVNLGDDLYEGGTLMVRRKGDESPMQGFQNRTAGDALLLRVAPSLEHYLTPVTGQVPRVSLVGWFQRAPAYADMLAAATAP